MCILCLADFVKGVLYCSESSSGLSRMQIMILEQWAKLARTVSRKERERGDWSWKGNKEEDLGALTRQMDLYQLARTSLS